MCRAIVQFLKNAYIQAGEEGPQTTNHWYEVTFDVDFQSECLDAMKVGTRKARRPTRVSVERLESDVNRGKVY